MNWHYTVSTVYTGINNVLAHFLLAKSKSVWFAIFHSNQYEVDGTSITMNWPLNKY